MNRTRATSQSRATRSFADEAEAKAYYADAAKGGTPASALPFTQQI